MSNSLALIRVTALIAFRNLFSHTATTLIVGSIILFGTTLVVTGTALLDSVESAMERTITSSFAGHIQIFSAEGRDDLALFGSGFMASEDVGEMRDFPAVRSVVESVPNVRAVVPMGLQFAQVVGGNDIDRLVEELRADARQGESASVNTGIRRLRSIAADLVVDYENRLEIARDPSVIEANLADLRRVDSDVFWNDDRSLEERLLWVSTRVAPLFQEGRVLFLRMLGTDHDQFREHFDRFRVVKGQPIPENTRGVMLSNRIYEQAVKHRVARWFDRLDAGSVGSRSLLVTDAELANLVERLPRQYRRITFDQDPLAADALREDLRSYLRREGSVEELIREFLTLTPYNFDERKRLFYELVAPRIDLYSVNVGDTITLRSFTQTGYLKSVNVKVFGVFQFEGLEGSELAGAQNLIDMLSFRELYGVMTAEARAELAEIRAEIGLEALDPESAEDALFGDESVEMQTRQTEAFDELTVLEEAIDAADALDDTYQHGAAQDGLALNAAVLLHDSSKLEPTMAAIRTATDEAGLRIAVRDWQSAAGLVGQFVTVVRLVLYVAIVIIFLVALVIINNSMIMATMERVAEIGTMRAIGSSRTLVMLMILLETLTLGAIAGVVGAGLGAAVIASLGQVGIPATSDVLVFLFSGPRLYPTFSVSNILSGVGAIVFVSLISTLYPARIATQIQPVVAMQRGE